jgi:hypothetical protein
LPEKQVSIYLREAGHTIHCDGACVWRSALNLATPTGIWRAEMMGKYIDKLDIFFLSLKISIKDFHDFCIIVVFSDWPYMFFLYLYNFKLHLGGKTTVFVT